MDPSTFLGSVWGMIWRVKYLLRQWPWIHRDRVDLRSRIDAEHRAPRRPRRPNTESAGSYPKSQVDKERLDGDGKGMVMVKSIGFTTLLLIFLKLQYIYIYQYIIN